MAFGLFGKKPPEKMSAKPPAKPRPVAEDPAATLGPGSRLPPVEPAASSRPSQPTAPAVEVDDDLDLDFTGIQLAEETDPLQAVIEQAAIDYANDNTAGAFAVLSEAVKVPDSSPDSERLWLMLFDLCQAAGERDRFSELELEYAQRFEKQPPAWKELTTAAATAATVGAATAFKGELVGSNAAGFELALQGVEKSQKLRLDFAKIKVVDPDGCQRLLDLLLRARKIRHEVELLGLENLGALLEPKVAAHDTSQSYWCLLLEVLQRQGRQEDFDNLAVDFAVTFEISPPAYEPPPKPVGVEKPVAKSAPKRPDDAFYLEGVITGGRIDGLDPWLKERESAVIDMAGVIRIDFTSAGALLNILTPHWQRGLSVVLRHPNRLISELLVVVGVGEMATISLAKK